MRGSICEEPLESSGSVVFDWDGVTELMRACYNRIKYKKNGYQRSLCLSLAVLTGNEWNGFRYFCFWYVETIATCETLEDHMIRVCSNIELQKFGDRLP